MELDEQTKKLIRDSYPKEQIEKWEKEADLGIAESQFQLGKYYYLDDDKKAFEFFSKAAEKSHPGAFYYLFNCYGNGRGVLQDNDKAMDYLSRSAAMEYGDAEYMMGMLHVSIGQNMTALDFFSRAMQHGNTDAWEEVKKLVPGIEKNFPDLPQ